MEEYQHPVFFDCFHLLIGKNKRKTEAYFSVRRRSGGGECGPLTRVSDNVYSIAFRNHQDQQEVLRKSEHTIDLTYGHLVLSVKGSLSLRSSIEENNPTAPAESMSDPTAPPSGKELKEQLDETELPSIKSCPDPEEPLTSGYYSAEHHHEEQEILEGKISQTEHVGEVGAKEDEDQQCGSCLEHCDENLHQVVAQQCNGEAGRAQAAAAEGTLVKPDILDAVDEPRLRDSCGTLSVTQNDGAVATYSLADGLQLVVYRGDITTFEADALVNLMNEELNHCEGIAAALIQAAGPEAQCKIDTLMNRKGNVPVGEVEFTTGGKLPCKGLLHAFVPMCKKADGREIVLLQRTICHALHFGELLKFKSIAMPCVGSGGTGIPVAVCSEVLISAVMEFCPLAGKSLETITLIDNREEVVKVMRDACDRLLLGESSACSTEGKDPHQLEMKFDFANENLTGGAAAGAKHGLVHVEIVPGSIESQQTDAVLSPMVLYDPLSTRVGNILSKVIGPQVNKMVRRKTKEKMWPGDFLLEEELNETPFGAAFFLSLVPWDKEQDGFAVQILRVGINKILTCCEGRGFGSVALPALGAGIALHFPIDLVAKVLQEEIYKFEQERTTSTPMRVLIVLHPEDEEGRKVFKSFLEETKYNRSRETVMKSHKDQDSSPKRIVLLGKTGSGKSHLANTILGKELFPIYHSPNSGTKTCQSETGTVNGRSLTLIDTPGFFDTARSEEELKPEIMSCLTECAPGPHVFLIVLKVEKFTVHEQQVFTKICEHFSEEALNYGVIVFTHGGQLEEGMKIEEFIEENEDLSKLVEICGGRCHVLDNKHWNGDEQDGYRSNRFQLEELLQTVDKMMLGKKERAYYTNGVLQHVEERIQLEEKQIKKMAVDLPPHEIRKRAKINVSNEFLIQLAGTATGVLLGAFFGVAGLLEVVLKVVRNPSDMMKHVKSFIGLAPPVAAAGSEVALVAAGVSAGVAMAVAATAGGVRGYAIGSEASKQAKTLMEAVEKSSDAVMRERHTFRMGPQN